MPKNSRLLIKLFSGFALSASVGCQGTFTHHGRSEGVSIYRPNGNTELTSPECESICSQTNPNGSCKAWLKNMSGKCLENIERKKRISRH